MQQLHPIISDILIKRGIQSEADMLEFFSQKPQLTYDPFLLLNMTAGVDLILSTIASQGKICIYGDYDADGVTSTSLLLEFLKNLTEHVAYYIPSRFDEGYGINNNALDMIKGNGTSLVITVDCGSVSYEEVAYAKSIGLEIMVTDHHNISDKPADCILINPKQEACIYPFKHLSGCGVAFKLAQALQRKTNLPKSVLTNLLDLVAIATIGDIVPLVDENRTLVKYGMNQMKKGKRKGLTMLIEKIGLNLNSLKSDHIAYSIVPHLNAAGRMLNAKIGVEVLTAEDRDCIAKNVEILVSNNKERKAVQSETLEKCLEIVELKHKEDSFLVVFSEDAHEGIAGIVAGKLKDTYGRPAILVTPIGEKTAENQETEKWIKGTGRSIETIDLYNTLEKYAYLFEKFGGHAGACGFSMKYENLEALREGIKETMDLLLANNPNLLIAEEKFDGILKVEDINGGFVEQLEKLAPFGHKNEKPVFKLENVTVSTIAYMGDQKQHMKIGISSHQEKISCILFHKAKEYDTIIKEGAQIYVIGSPEANVWNKKTSMQFQVQSIGRIR